ncbi:MAG: IS630 transposase-related protein, partial [Cyanobacteria bacterium P01_D01_bin.73]
IKEMHVYNLKLRREVIDFLQSGNAIDEAVEKYQLPRKIVSSWFKEHNKTWDLRGKSEWSYLQGHRSKVTHFPSGLEFLSDPKYWSYGPCFELNFYFQVSHYEPYSFQNLFLGDPDIKAIPAPTRQVDFVDDLQRCAITFDRRKKPIGFIYYARQWTSTYTLHFATYPQQVREYCGDFSWQRGENGNEQKVIDFYIDLVCLIRRLRLQFQFELVSIRHEGTPGFYDPWHSLSGIIVYDWIADLDDFFHGEPVTYRKMLLPLKMGLLPPSYTA